MRLILILLLFLTSLPLPADPGPMVERTTPPAFGYTVGSLIRHRIDVFTPHPWRLETARLPAAGPLSDWLEIRKLTWRQEEQADGLHYSIQITYQIFPSLPEPGRLAVPELTLAFVHPQRPPLLRRLPPWTFTAAPLIPGKLADHLPQPLWQPGPRNLKRHWHRLGWLGGGILFTLTLLAWRQRWLPWQRTPFRRALAAIRTAMRDRDPQSAVLAFHRALNQTAGYALFQDRLERFLRQHPQFRPLEAELERFFRTSRKLFFQGHESPEFLERLESLCRACIRAEKP